MLDRPVCHLQTRFDGELAGVARGAFYGVIEMRQVIRMNARTHHVDGGRDVRIKVEDPVHLLGPDQLSAGETPTRAARQADTLRFRENSLMSPAFLF